MNALSGNRLLEFTNDLDRIAVAIGTIRQSGKLGNGQEINIQDRDNLLVIQIKLLRESARFYAESIVLDADEIKGQLNALKDATLSIDKALAKMKTVDQIIKLSSSALQVATAVTSGDVVAVAASLNALLSIISDTTT